MKTLRDFLLAEAKGDKDKKGKSDNSEKIPAGFEVISNKGRLTDEAKLAMGGTFKQGMKSAMESQDVRDKIKGELKAPSPKPDSVRDILTKVVNAKNDLDLVFKDRPKDFDPDGLIISFKSADWASLAGTSSSSARLVKFWLQSSLVAYGYNKTKAMSVVFSIDKKQHKIAVCGS